jgi:hypothetical protein
MNIDKEIIGLKTQNVNYPVNYRKLVPQSLENVCISSINVKHTIKINQYYKPENANPDTKKGVIKTYASK